MGTANGISGLSVILWRCHVAVEDPSEEFQRLRDFVDSSNCLTLPTFQPHCLQDVFTAGMADEARLKLKLCKVASLLTRSIHPLTIYISMAIDLV